MSKKNLIFSILFLIGFISAFSLSVSPIKLGVEVGDDQSDTNITVLSTPKSSGYAVNERWNYSSSGTVNVVAVSADGKYMVAATNKSGLEERGINRRDEIFFFNTSAHDGKPMWSCRAPNHVDSLAISANGKYIVAGSQDLAQAGLFNSTMPDPGEDKEPLWYVDADGPVSSVDISADGKLIVVGGYEEGANGFILLYNNSYASAGYHQDKAEEYIWAYHPENYTLTVVISADGKYVAAGTETGEDEDGIFFFNTSFDTFGEEHQPEWTFDAGVDFDSVAISADGEYIIAGSSFGGGDAMTPDAVLLNKTVPDPLSSEKTAVWEFRDEDYVVTSEDISATGKDIVLGLGGLEYGDDAGAVAVYNHTKPTSGIDKTEEIRWFGFTEGNVSSVSITADGRYIVAGAEYDPQIGADNESTVFLFENFDYTLEDLHDPWWSCNTSYDVNSVSISAWGNHFAAGGDYTSGRTYLFYHARPIPSALRPYVAGDDDDDDDDESAIPFGNYYLIFAATAVVALIIIYQRKTTLGKK